MNDPERLLDGDSESPLVRTMISAARDEQPPERALQRTLLAVGAGVAVLGASAAAGGASIGATSSAIQATTTTSFGLIAKWLGIGASAGLLTAGAALQVEQHFADRPTPRLTAAPPAAVEAAPANQAGAPRPIAPTQRDPEPGAKQPAKARPPALAPSEPLLEEDDPSLNAEVAALDRARKALASGNSERALAELGAYNKEFPAGRLGPEALFLRMEAAAHRGDHAAAESAARQLLASHPNSPHAARARAVLSRSKNQ
jgi:hypothetical protein